MKVIIRPMAPRDIEVAASLLSELAPKVNASGVVYNPMKLEPDAFFRQCISDPSDPLK